MKRNFKQRFIMKLVIIGGVAGGASAAARARRLKESAQITMFERGDHISFANCGLPYHIGGMIAERSKLLIQTPQAMKSRFNIDVRVKTEVIGIDRQAKEVIVRDLIQNREYRQPYDKLLLSPGAEPVRPNIPGINSKNVFTLRSIADMDVIKTAVDKNTTEQVVIMGGGYIGLEMAESLRHRNVEVTMVELDKQVFGPIDFEMASMVGMQLRLHGVDLHLGNSITGIEEREEGLHVHLSSGDTINCSLIIVAIGVKPESTLAKNAGLTIGSRGGIVVDEHLQTNDPDIYAIGDAIEVEDFVGGFETMIPLAGPANRQGRIAADNIMGKTSVYRKTQGTGICKVFNLAVGMTGLSEKTLKRLGRSYEKVYVHPANHATYYPGAAQISLKLIFDPVDGRILGAQAIGSEGVDKRIDVLATAIRAGMTVRDLADLELAYAPPYGSAKDPVNYAGFVATNVLDGLVKICHTEDMLNSNNGQMIVDVRSSAEVEAGTISGAINVPVDQLRGRLSELPKDKELLVFCQVGLRGYIACRILSQNGYNCRNLSGGYRTFQSAALKGSEPIMPQEKVEMKDDAGSMGIEAKEKKSITSIVKHIDACGLQCPGPIMQLRDEMNKLEAGQAITISTRDIGFAADVPAWCHSTGNELADLVNEDGVLKATIVKHQAKACVVSDKACRSKTIVVFSNDFDRVMASLIIANGAASMGSEVTMFFTFWGLNALRKKTPEQIHKSIIEWMFGVMMPRGASKLKLSKMNMGGIGTAMMKGIMQRKNVSSLEELIEKAKASGIKLVACSMSMDIMGIRKEELIDGVELGGVAMYLDHAEAGNVNLFV
jgi:NADPH-dependent 2,4-dienoyl-CoA reductase/sulfur reductase-like enzyme/peroxiredoxin family protein/rhodanese-related sulfurtransferase/TusA-related sulfurtransferase